MRRRNAPRRQQHACPSRARRGTAGRDPKPSASGHAVVSTVVSSGREPAPELVQVRLDAAVLGREVVRDEQRRHGSSTLLVGQRCGGFDRCRRLRPVGVRPVACVRLGRRSRRPAAGSSPRPRPRSPVANAPRLPVSAATAPQMNAPTPWLRSKNDETVPTTDARSSSDTPLEREQQERGIHERHADREHDRADDQPDDRRPRGDDADPDGRERRARSMPARRPPSRSGSRAPTMRTTRISTP